MLAHLLLQDPLTVFGIGLALLILFFWYFATDVERRKRNVGTVLTIGICALCILAATPPKDRLKGGIDILGGSSFSLRIQTARPMPMATKCPSPRRRWTRRSSSSKNASTAWAPPNRSSPAKAATASSCKCPASNPKNPPSIRTTLEKVAKLELREVSPRNEEAGPDGKSLADRVLRTAAKSSPATAPTTYKGKDEDGNEFKRPILLNRRMALGGSDIAKATPSPQQADAVAITLNGDGTDKMIALTKNMRPGRTASPSCSTAR